MHLIINNGETVQITYGQYQGHFGTVTRLIVAANRKSYAYTVKLRPAQDGQWASLTTRFSFDQIKRAKVS
ncbi:MAG: hypothetical protein H7256_02725 [Bdellovibrio sp.]|nr:hypothetical protein [Bdellovibrio sp.]